MCIRGILLLALVALAARAAPPASVTLANGEWPPYQSRDLPHCGPASQIVEEAFASQGIRVEYQFYPWKRAYELAREGTLDGTLVWARTAEREADFLYSDPVLTTHIVLFYAKSDPIRWRSLDDLASYRIGGALGYYYGDEAARLAREGVLKMQIAPNDKVNLRKIAAHHIDLSPMDRDAGLYLLSTELRDIAGDITFDPREVGSAEHYLLISRKAPNAEELIRAFNAGLGKLRSSGRLAELQGPSTGR